MREAVIYSLHNQTKLHINFSDGGKWTRSYLKEILGSRVQLNWIKDTDGRVWWEISKTHREKLTEALRERYESVWVVRDYSTKQICTTSCQRAEKDDCVCSCGGQFHGGGGEWKFVKGDMLIGTEVRRIARHYYTENANTSPYSLQFMV